MTTRSFQGNKRSRPRAKPEPLQAPKLSPGADHALPMPDTSSPENILYLQRLVGNQAVQRMLNGTIQREDDEAEGPLTPKQVAEAIAWYKAQPTKYTEDIIKQIQAAVGTDETGKMAAKDVQAVAEHQKTIDDSEKPTLKIDGKAGPRTLPTIFKQGLAPDKEVKGFVANTRQDVFSKWATLSAEERIRELAKEANKRLKASGVHETELIIGDAEGNLGQFDFESWSLEIGKPAFENNTPTAAQMADMADTIYHESRHAEQWFRMAQMLAGRKKTPAQIMKIMSIKKQSVADAAFASPLAPGSMEALIADGWFESVYGSGSDHRSRVLAEVANADKALKKAKADFAASATPGNQKKLDDARKRQRKSRVDFFELPEENDASRVGGRVTTEFLATESAPTP